ncbi:MAG: YlxR family protein [Aeromicrobium sp.]
MSSVIRTCIGCRERVDKTTLVRVVGVRSSSVWMITPDPNGSLPGRGAHLHPTARCLEQAIRRKAFGRALRIEGTIDTNLVSDAVQDRNDQNTEPSK